MVLNFKKILQYSIFLNILVLFSLSSFTRIPETAKNRASFLTPLSLYVKGNLGGRWNSLRTLLNKAAEEGFTQPERMQEAAVAVREAPVLRKEVRDRAAEVNQLQARLDGVNKTNAALQEQLTKARADRKTLQEQLTKAGADRKTLQAQLDKAQREAGEAAQVLLDVQGERDQAQQDARDQAQLQVQAAQAAQDAQTEQQRLQTELTQKETENKKLQAQVKQAAQDALRDAERLQRQLDEKNTENQRLQKELNAANERATNSKGAQQKAEAEKETAEAARAQIENNRDAVQRKIEYLKEQLETLNVENTRLQELTAELDVIKTENAQFRENIKVLDQVGTERDELQNQLKILQEQLVAQIELQEQLRVKERELQALTTEKDAAEKSLYDANANNEKLIKELAAIAAKLEKQQELQFDELPFDDDQVKNLEEKNRELITRNAELTEQNMCFLEQEDERNIEIKNLRQQLEMKSNELEIIRASLEEKEHQTRAQAETNQELEAIRKKLQDAEARLNDAVEENGRLREQVDSERNSYNTSKRRRAELEKQITDLQAKLAQQDIAPEEIEPNAKIQRLKEEIQELNLQLREKIEIEKFSEELKETVDQMVERLKKSTNELDKTKREIDKLREEVEQIKKSASEEIDLIVNDLKEFIKKANKFLRDDYQITTEVNNKNIQDVLVEIFQKLKSKQTEVDSVSTDLDSALEINKQLQQQLESLQQQKQNEQ